MSRFLLLPLAIITACGFCAAAPAQARPVGAAYAERPAAGQPLVKPGDHNCLRSTGSLIPPKRGECLPVAGRSYSHEELERTGARNTADALRMLDPSVTVRGH